MGKELWPEERIEKTRRTEQTKNNPFQDKAFGRLDDYFHEEQHCRLKISIEKT